MFGTAFYALTWGGRVARRCWVNFQCRGVLLIWIIVGQGSIVLAVGAGGGCVDFFSLIYHFSFPSPSLWETARYRLKYCLKGPLSPKQPASQLCTTDSFFSESIFAFYFRPFGIKGCPYIPLWPNVKILIIQKHPRKSSFLFVIFFGLTRMLSAFS